MDAVIHTLADEWRSAGIEQGDMVLVHSSIARTLRRIARMGGGVDPGLIMRSFLAAVGESGTILLPLFNFDFTRGVAFDIRNSPSQMGSFTEVGRHWPGAVRTGHPIYSFAAVGKDAEAFRGLTNFSGYGADSPFGVLHRAGGKIGVIDLPDANSMTYYHYVEECRNVPYRYHKTFTGDYIDNDGMQSVRTFGLFVRNLEQGVQTHVDPMGELLWQKGLYSGFRPGEGCGLRVIPARAMFDEVASVIDQGHAKGLLFEYQSETDVG